MTVEELLKPRYKVAFDYPNSPFEVGQIIEMTGKTNRIFDEPEDPQVWASDFLENKDGSKTAYYETLFNPYPHLFRKLEWWEERDKSIFPVYVKSDKAVYKVTDICYEENTIWLYDKGGSIQLTPKMFLETKELATEQEYNDYIKTNQ